MATDKLYYVIVNEPGDLSKLGPYKTDEERDAAAKETWAEMDQETSSVGWLNVDPGILDDPVSIGDYTASDLGDDEEAEEDEDDDE